MADLLPPYPSAWVWGAALLLTLSLSGVWVRTLLHLGGQSTPEGAKGPGMVIGKLENVIVISLVIIEAYTAMALIFAAKGLVRKDTGADHESYYVLGTLANFTWALGIGLASRYLIFTSALVG